MALYLNGLRSLCALCHEASCFSAVSGDTPYTSRIFSASCSRLPAMTSSCSGLSLAQCRLALPLKWCQFSWMRSQFMRGASAAMVGRRRRTRGVCARCAQKSRPKPAFPLLLLGRHRLVLIAPAPAAPVVIVVAAARVLVVAIVLVRALVLAVVVMLVVALARLAARGAVAVIALRRPVALSVLLVLLVRAAVRILVLRTALLRIGHVRLAVLLVRARAALARSVALAVLLALLCGVAGRV